VLLPPLLLPLPLLLLLQVKKIQHRPWYMLAPGA